MHRAYWAKSDTDDYNNDSNDFIKEYINPNPY